MLPFQYIGDCLGHLRALWSGSAHAAASSRGFHADLWRRILRKLRDHGIDAGSAETSDLAVKVKAHRTLAAATAAGDTTVDWEGNRRTDEAAKRAGIDLIPEPDRTAALGAAVAELRAELAALLGAGGRMLGHWRSLQPQRPKTRPLVRPPREVVTHSLIGCKARGWKCRFCNVRANTPLDWALMRHRACRGLYPCVYLPRTSCVSRAARYGA